jgi:AAA domain
VCAGGRIATLARDPQALRLTDNRRQAEAWERRALADLRAGDPDAAVAGYAAHHRIHAVAAAEELPAGSWPTT